MKRHQEQERSADYRAALIAASIFNAQGGIGGRAIQPWDLMPHLRTPLNIKTQRTSVEQFAAATGIGNVGVLEDVVIMPRGWRPGE